MANILSWIAQYLSINNTFELNDSDCHYGDKLPGVSL